MKKTVTRKGFIAFAAAAVMAIALAGCGGGSSAPAASGSGATSAAPSGDTSAAATSPAATPAATPASGASLRFVTGGEAGTYYALGTIMSQNAGETVGLDVTAVSSGGSQANVQEIEDGTAQLGFCQADVEAYAYLGTNLFEGAPVSAFSTVACLYEEQVQIITCNPDIKSVADLKGKNVSIGAAGSGVYFNAIDVLGAYGLTEGDINPTYQSFADSTEALKDGKIDAAFIVAGAPTASVSDLAATKEFYLIEIDAEHAAELVKTSPYYNLAVIPAGTYPGQKADVATLSVGAVVIAANTVSDDDVYKFLSSIYDNLDALSASHDKFKEFSLEKGASVVSVPYHPGAAKYFAEKGLTVPTA